MKESFDNIKISVPWDPLQTSNMELILIFNLLCLGFVAGQNETENEIEDSLPTSAL